MAVFLSESVCINTTSRAAVRARKADMTSSMKRGDDPIAEDYAESHQLPGSGLGIALAIAVVIVAVIAAVSVVA